MKIPDDIEERNIIDKLANFVARNGPKFEELTKSKQKDSPKFAFLFGGDHHAYYKWKVTLETAQVEAQKRQAALAAANTDTAQQSNDTTNTSDNPPPSSSVPVEEDSSQLDIKAFRDLVQKLILACTKDNIQNGKNWVVNNAKTEEQRRLVSQFLFRRLIEECLPFQQKLHIVYLANDILHHSRKKELPQLQESLQEYILPIVGVVINGESAENRQKVSKVLKIWENQSFFSEDVREKLKDPTRLYDQFLNFIDAEKADMKKEEEEEQEKLKPNIKMEEEVSNVVSSQIQAPNYNYPPPSFPPDMSVPPPSSQGIPPSTQGPPPQGQGQPFPPYQQYAQRWNRPPPNMSQPPPPVDQGMYFEQPFRQRGPPPDNQRFPPPGFQQQGFPPPGPRGDSGFDQGPHGQNWNQQYDMPPPHNYQSGPPPNVQTFDYSHQSVPNQPPPGAVPGGEPISIDYEHGRGGAMPDPPTMQERDPTIPQAPYYDLPAGLIVPLVKLWDCEYKPIDPKDIRLPIPQPPSQRLLAAVEAFYAPPSHDRPRDSQGWEKNGLFEFYKAKIKYIRDKERKLEIIPRTPSPIGSRSCSPESDNLVTSKPRDSRSRSRSRSKSRTKSRSPRSRSRSKSRSRSRSRSGSQTGKRSKSRSRSKSNSQSPRRKGSRSRSRSYSRSPTPQKQPIQRSPTPPEFIGFETKSLDTRIEESNIGHKMLAKMGWGGQGLGKKESGIVEPIAQDAVREKQDKYKGVGLDVNDPFDNYRKNKSYTYSRPRSKK